MTLHATVPRFRWSPSSADPEPGAVALQRRGVHHGFLVSGGRAAAVADLRIGWRASRPLYLPGVLSRIAPDRRNEIRRTRTLFERARRGTLDFQFEVWRRLGDRDDWEPAGAAIDLADEREIEKVFADERRGRRVTGRDVWAKLSWVAHDPADESLRIRFSFGSETHGDWSGDRTLALAADRFAEAVFPECAEITANGPLTNLLRRLNGRAVRLSERIVFANAPGGGAVFHHDHEPRQLGVAFGQLAGRTVWFALPKRELAEVVASLARGGLASRVRTAARALRVLERPDSPALDRLLNSSSRLTHELVRRRACFVLRAGDVLLLPSHGPDDVAWHSVFALGSRPSLAHSYGIFARR